jgi:hypothetical protein
MIPARAGAYAYSEVPPPTNGAEKQITRADNSQPPGSIERTTETPPLGNNTTSVKTRIVFHKADLAAGQVDVADSSLGTVLIPVSGTDRGLSNPVYIANSTGDAPDLNSINMHMLSLIVRGDIAGASEYYLLATGASQVPRWLTTMQQAFNVGNQVAGRCEAVANNIAEGFRKLGQNPQLVKIFGDKGQYLSWQGQKMVSNNNFHVAVMNDGRIFDAYTGPAGMTWVEYQAAIQTANNLFYTVLP